MKETPTIAATNYANSVVDFSSSGQGLLLTLQDLGDISRGQVTWGGVGPYQSLEERFPPDAYRHQPQQPKPNMATATRRVVQVFIADPNDNVPLDESVLFKGEQKLTDLNDTELFFEVPIATLLSSHNEKRTKWLDKEATKRAGKDVTLDAVKIRDLKMVVVTVAQF